MKTLSTHIPLKSSCVVAKLIGHNKLGMGSLLLLYVHTSRYLTPIVVTKLQFTYSMTIKVDLEAVVGAIISKSEVLLPVLGKKCLVSQPSLVYTVICISCYQPFCHLLSPDY